MSNELCKKELKALIANQVNIADDSLTSFAEAVYVRAKTLIMFTMLKQG